MFVDRAARRSPRIRQSPLEQIVQVGNLVVDEGEFTGEALNFRFGSSIHLVVELASQAILRVLAVLAHHDHRRLERGNHREKQIEQNEGVGIPGRRPQHEIDDRCRGREYSGT